MKLHLTLLLSSILFLGEFVAQCPSGAMAVTGSGCGCSSGCNLTPLGGPNCSPAVTGNCSSGYINMAPVDIVVPAGCTFTVTATMANRPGCTASGADGNCQTCDGLKVDVIPGGVKNNQQGGANATLTDTYVLVGPGTIRVTGRANRADEIVTFSVTSTGCVDCVNPLPIQLVEFKATPQKSAVHLNWITASELNNDYFTIERSVNGIDFEPYAMMKGAGNSSSLQYYSLVDSSPLNGLSYYRLKQTDFDGAFDYSEIKSVLFREELDIELYPNPANHFVELRGKHLDESEVSVVDALGQTVVLVPSLHQDHISFETSELRNGMYFVKITHNDERQVLKLVVQH